MLFTPDRPITFATLVLRKRAQVSVRFSPLKARGEAKMLARICAKIAPILNAGAASGMKPEREKDLIYAVLVAALEHRDNVVACGHAFASGSSAATGSCASRDC